MNSLTPLIISIYLGTATFYHSSFHGRITANGDRYNQNKLTAAHMSLPFNTIVLVRNIANNKSVIVRINDRGRFNNNNIDLSKAAFMKIANLSSGRIRVQIKIIKLGDKK